ncbi:MAG: right-handed parallel beta-helix repeat-containing protein [Armatimonadetes bacterium]|nr:right-handed parallel beta-helix repeat-containing protein [Armatimonadota bacterium]
MRFPTPTISLTLLCCVPALPAAAKTLYVPSSHYPTIQSAVNAAASGDTVLVAAKPTPYAESVRIHTDGIVLQGKNNPVLDGSTVTTGPDPIFPGVQDGPSGIIVEASHVAVRGFTVQNFSRNEQYDGNPEGFPAAGIRLGGDTDANGNPLPVVVHDVEVSGCVSQNNYFGYLIGSLANAGDPAQYRIFANLATRNLTHGFLVYSGNTALTGNRSLQNAQQGAGNGDGITTGFDNGVVITGNETAGNVNGISVFADFTAAQQPPTYITFNNVHDNQQDGIIPNNGVSAIGATGSITVSGNVISGNSIGIDLSYGISHSTISYNTVTNNTGQNQGSFSGIGIDAGYGDTCTVANNVVTGSAADGIYVDDFVSSTFSNNQVNNNGGSLGYGFDGYGFDVTAVSGATSATADTFIRNTAHGNNTYDAYDANGKATLNTWTQNSFGPNNVPNNGR